MVTKRILILDDDDDFREDLAEFLVGEGHEVVGIGDARAMPLERMCRFDVILLDLSMPACDGTDVLKQIAASCSLTSVIIISGSAQDVISAVADAARLRNIQIRGTLKKPFDPQALLALLETGPSLAAGTVAREDGPSQAVLAAALTRALDAGTLPVMFQPKMETQSLRFAGAETLLGTALDGIGPVSPPEMVAAAGSVDGLLSRLTMETVRAGVAAHACWEAAGHHGPVSVNVPLTVFLEPDLDDRLEALVRAAGQVPSALICELTEDALYDSSSDSLIALAQSRMKGFGLALDDMGQRQSGLLQLARLPVTELKIDMELLRQARSSDKARSIFSSLVELGHRLSMKVVAEGVETLEDLNFVRSRRVDYVQGYLLSRKLALADLMTLLEAWPEQQQALQRAAGEANGWASAERASRFAG